MSMRIFILYFYQVCYQMSFYYKKYGIANM